MFILSRFNKIVGMNKVAMIRGNLEDMAEITRALRETREATIEEVKTEVKRRKKLQVQCEENSEKPRKAKYFLENFEEMFSSYWL